MENTEMPQEDIIDEVLLDLIDEMVGEGASDADIDNASDVIFDLAQELVDDGIIQDIPEIEDTEALKKSWLEKDFVVLKEKVEQFINSDIVPEDNGDNDVQIC